MPPRLRPTPHYGRSEHQHKSRAHPLPNPHDLEIQVTREKVCLSPFSEYIII